MGFDGEVLRTEQRRNINLDLGNIFGNKLEQLLQKGHKL